MSILARVREARVAQTSAALLFSQLLLGVAGILAARLLGPSGRGIVAGVGAWAGVLPSLYLLGMSEALSVRVASRPNDAGVALASAVAYVASAGAVVALAAALLVPRFVAHLGHGAFAAAEWAVPTGVLAAMLTELLLQIALARKQYAVYNGCRILLPLVPFGVVLGFTVTGGLTPRLMIGANVAAALACFVWVASRAPWSRFHFDGRSFASDFRFGVTNAIGSWAGFVNIRLDFLLMSGFVSAAQLGYYGVANNVMIPVVTVPYAAAAVLTPRVAAVLGDDALAGAEKTHRQVALIRSTAVRYVAIAIAGGAALAVAAPFLIPALFGHAFRPAVVLIWILIPGFVARSAMSVLAAGATGMRRPRVANSAELVALVVTVVLLATLLPSLKAKGAAIASTAAYVTAASVAALTLRRIAADDARSLVESGIPGAPPRPDPAP